MNTLIPQLKACSIAAAIAALTACGGGSDPVTTSDACKNGAGASFAQFDASTGKSLSVYAKDRDEDDENEHENEHEHENDHDSDDRVVAATDPTTAGPAVTEMADAPPTANCDTVATPTPAPSPSPSPSPAPTPAPSPAPAPAPTPAPAPAPAPASNNSVRGKALYSANCAACHGANPLQNISSILKGRNASTTLSAIAKNKGGMGFLSGKIGSSEATDIAIYLNAP